MIKFSSEDNEYHKVLVRNQSLIQDARKAQEVQTAVIAQNGASQPTLSPQTQRCLKSLAFKEMESRLQDVESAVSGTCEWLLQHEAFENWERFNKEILWIKGKPGSGKSTLLSYVFAYQKNLLGASDSDLVLSFFFHGRGIDLQKTTLGLFRSLLHQILRQMPGYLSDLVDTYENRRNEIGEYNSKWQWHPKELWFALEASLLEILETRSVWLFVDALDECGEDSAKDLVQKFKLLFQKSVAPYTRSNQLHICFSCRHYPILSSPGLAEVCLERENQADIHTYLNYEMSSFEDSIPSTMLDIIIERASGVFLWAQFVVKQMQKLALEGAGPDQIKAAVDSIPKDLESLYTELMRDMTDDSIKLMLWIHFAERPLSVDELRWAMAIDASCLSLQACQNTADYIPDDKCMAQQIVSLSRGLAGIVPLSDSYTVQFIHQSVNDFFIDKGLIALCGNRASINEAIGKSHLYLYRTCIRYLAMEEIQTYHDFGFETPDQTIARFPFLDYALDSWLSHMKQSDDYDIPAEQILELLPWPPQDLLDFWIYTYESLNSESPDCASLNPSLLHLAAGYGIQGVLTVILQRSDLFSREVDSKDDNGQTPLSLAAERGHKAGVRLLLDTGRADINSQDDLGQTPLSYAAGEGHEAVVKLLLVTGQADINSKDIFGRTPLSYAAEWGHEAIVILLQGYVHP